LSKAIEDVPVIAASLPEADPEPTGRLVQAAWCP
jgi:hypothetical protein